MAGRPRKPQKLHVLQGTAQKVRMDARADELQVPAGDVGDPPEYFSADSLEEWNRITSDEIYKQVLSPLHRTALVEYCSLVSRMIEDAKGLYAMNASQRQTLQSLRMQLGLTPASQSKVKAPGSKKPANKWASVG